jgi:non-specific serine/threonine protein kinase
MVEDEDYENVRAAIAWTREGGETDLELRLAAAMGLYWSAAGYLSEGRAWLEDALSRAASASAQARAPALRSCANLAWRQGEPERSTELAETALAIFSELGDRLGAADCAFLLGVAAEWRGDYEEQARRYEQAEETFRELGYERGLALILNNRGYVAVVLGDYERAEQLLRESLEVQSNPEQGAYMLLNLGVALLGQSKVEEAAAAFLPALEESSRAGQRETIFYALEGLADVAAAGGAPLRGAKLWGASEAIRDALGVKLAAAELKLHEEAVPAARLQAGEDAFDRAWAEGRALSQEQAVALGLSEEP